MSVKKIVEVRQLPSGSPDDPHWCITHQNQDSGVIWCTVIPLSQLALRSAEYGIDYHDFDTLSDVVLHEFEDGVSVDTEDPTQLFNTDQRTARTHHLARVSASKENVTYADPDGHLDKLKRAHLAAYHPSTQNERGAKVAVLRGHRQRGR